MPHFCNVVWQFCLREGISRLGEQVRDWLVSHLPLRVRFTGLQTDRLLRYPIACLHFPYVAISEIELLCLQFAVASAFWTLVTLVSKAELLWL